MAATYTNGVLSLNVANAGAVGSNDSNPFIGNGKVGAVLTTGGSASRIGADACMITSTLDSSQHRYSGNTIATFNPLTIAIDGFAASNSSLDMNCAIYNIAGYVAASNIAVSCDFYCPQNLPFCLVQTVRLNDVGSNSNSGGSNSGGSNSGGSNMIISHHVTTPDSVRDPEFNNNVIYNGQTGAPIYMLTAQGFLTGGRQIVSASAYVFDDVYENLGFNIPIYEPDNCFNLFQVPRTTRFSIITATMTSDDFDAPLEEAKRIVLSVLNKTVSNVRADHVGAWSKIWKSDVTIAAKTGITAADEADIQTCKRALKSALYSIYSCVRSGVNLDINPAVLGFLDRTGQGLYAGDLTLIPCLLLLKPECARAILDYRYKTLGLAAKLAAGYGYSGAKFPYQDDRLGYKNALYWTTVSTMTVFNTAAISINVWNYYRTVQDMDWLRSIGYPVLKANATFFVSLVGSAEGSGGGGGGQTNTNGCCCSSYDPVHIDNVVGIAGRASVRDNTFTNALVRQAMRYAVEASYEISVAVPDAWIEIYHALVLPVATSDVYKIDAVTPAARDMPIPEPLTAFVPYFADVNTGQQQNIAFTGIDSNTRILNNLTAYESASSNPVSQWLQGTLYGVCAQNDPARVPDFTGRLRAFIAEQQRGPWGFFPDTSTAAMLVLMVAQGLAKLNVVGGVAETRFYYAEMGISSLISANLPPAWDTLRIMVNGKPHLTRNVLYYV